MILESGFIYVILVAAVIIVLLTISYKFWKGKPKDEIDKTIIDLNIMIFSSGFMIVVFMFLLPFPSFISPSGLPESIGDSQSNEELLSYANNLGLALDRLRDIIYFFFIFIVFGLLGSFYQVTKLVSSLREKDNSESSMDLEKSISQKMQSLLESIRKIDRKE
ncbi:hypothetical protein [Rhodohalobacter sp. 8-1]|uniref:hypothetical protein n=1 Tax=Rhodohalobacter sp. 8-1 TaxID=3131972 RepID=UPI0030EE07AA